MRLRDKFTVCVLLYGDYPQLASRCLQSLVDVIGVDELNIRVGMNQVSPAIREWVQAWLPSERVFLSEDDARKYPMMRRMFYGDAPIETPYTMWFDDDSYLVRQAGAGPWLQMVEQAMVNADLIGSIYKMGFQGDQKEFIRRQPWYTGKDPTQRKSFRFATGGWWTARTDILRKYDYPWPDLGHNGGDVMLGELCLQQNLRLRHFNTGVKINADDNGKESASKRRGLSNRPYGFYSDNSAASAVGATQTPPGAR